eukprot:scaffold297410_cov30-Tisochrysis_lutea.AAC.1
MAIQRRVGLSSGRFSSSHAPISFFRSPIRSDGVRSIGAAIPWAIIASDSCLTMFGNSRQLESTTTEAPVARTIVTSCAQSKGACERIRVKLAKGSGWRSQVERERGSGRVEFCDARSSRAGGE